MILDEEGVARLLRSDAFTTCRHTLMRDGLSCMMEEASKILKIYNEYDVKRSIPVVPERRSYGGSLPTKDGVCPLSASQIN